MRNDKGFALLAAIFVIIVFAILGIVAVSLMSGESILALRDYNSMRAIRLADAGLNYTIAASLSADSDWRDNTGFSKNLSPGKFYVDYLYRARKYCILLITGEARGIRRSITVALKRGQPSPFDYGIFASNPSSQTLYVQNQATIYGDFYYNGPVVMQQQSNLLNGTMYSQSMDDSSCLNRPIPWELIQVIDPPSFESTYYDNLLALLSPPTTESWDSNATLALGGGIRRYSSVTIQNGGAVVGPGTLEVTSGNFVVKNGGRVSDEVTIIVSQEANLEGGSIYGSLLNLICGGTINVNNSSAISPEAVLFTKRGSILFGQSTTIWGSLLAPSGEVNTGNQSVLINGIMYGQKITLGQTSQLFGSAIVLQVGLFKNQATVTFDPAKFPAKWPEGLGGSSTTEALVTIVNWKENF